MFLVFILVHQFIYNSLKARSNDFAFLFNAFYTPIEFLFTAFYIRLAIVQTFLKKIINISVFFYFITCLLFIILQITAQNDFITKGVTYSLILFYCLLYLFDQIKAPQTIFIYTQSTFWGIVAFLLFASGTFFVFIYFQFAKGMKQFLDQYVYIHAIFFLVRNILFSISIVVYSKNDQFWKKTLKFR